MGNEGFRIPRRFVGATPSTTNWPASRRLSKRVSSRSSTIATPSLSNWARIRRHLRSSLANAPRCPSAHRTRGAHSRAALLPRVRRQPRYCDATSKSSSRSTTATWPSARPISWTSKSGCCAVCRPAARGNLFAHVPGAGAGSQSYSQRSGEPRSPICSRLCHGSGRTRQPHGHRRPGARNSCRGRHGAVFDGCLGWRTGNHRRRSRPGHSAARRRDAGSLSP